MKQRLLLVGLSVLMLLLLLVSTALAASTWYVNGVNGNDANSCKTLSKACKTIGHAISLASSGDTIIVAPATYTENLTINISLAIIGAPWSTQAPVIDGGRVNTVVTIPNPGSNVTLSRVTIQNGLAYECCGGIYNTGSLTISNSTLSMNIALNDFSFGGGIYNTGSLTMSNSTLSGNTADYGGGIENDGTMSITKSTFSGNSSVFGGGVSNGGALTITNSTLSGNIANGGKGGGIYNGGTLTISNSTLSGNSASYGGGGIDNEGSTTSLQNTIVANNSPGGNCLGPITSNGYNLSSDGTCHFSGIGDLNNTDPKLGPLQNNGGPTQTQALLTGSPAIDAGNPTGCTDGNGNLLKTDQRGYPRPDPEDPSGCDMGAYERQGD